MLKLWGTQELNKPKEHTNTIIFSRPPKRAKPHLLSEHVVGITAKRHSYHCDGRHKPDRSLPFRIVLYVSNHSPCNPCQDLRKAVPLGGTIRKESAGLSDTVSYL